MRFLVIKTSSLGDILHTLPALSDARVQYPEISFDWVVEESFQEVPAWHPAVAKVIPVALRRWRSQGWQLFKNGEIGDFIERLRAEKYDGIIDAQGLLKSAAITRLARGQTRIGYSWHSAREALASLFYQKKALVPWGPHAVRRARSLFAQGLGYALPNTPEDYGIDINRMHFSEFETKSVSEKPYVVFLHATTWASKHWPESYWIDLAKIADSAGFNLKLLWGNATERARADRIAAVVPAAAWVTEARLSLGEVKTVLAGAQGIVTVDTGLGHLAAALGVPTVSLYGPSDPIQSGTLGKRQRPLAADFKCAPCFSRVCTYRGEKNVDPPCFSRLSPKIVWRELMTEIEGG